MSSVPNERSDGDFSPAGSFFKSSPRPEAAGDVTATDATRRRRRAAATRSVERVAGATRRAGRPNPRRRSEAATSRIEGSRARRIHQP
eukprot:31260-Pelagococcus_subviridis.AAC.8